MDKKILRLNMTTGEVQKEDVPAACRDLGGRGLTSTLVASEVPPMGYAAIVIEGAPEAGRLSCLKIDKEGAQLIPADEWKELDNYTLVKRSSATARGRSGDRSLSGP